MALEIECWSIIIILAIAAYMFIRRHKGVWAGSVFPLMLVPFVTIIYLPVVDLIYRRAGLAIIKHDFTRNVTIRIIVYAAVFVGASLWMILWARKLPAGKSKYAYITMGIAFTFLLILLFFRDLVFRPYF